MTGSSSSSCRRQGKTQDPISEIPGGLAGGLEASRVQSEKRGRFEVNRTPGHEVTGRRGAEGERPVSRAVSRAFPHDVLRDVPRDLLCGVSWCVS